MEKMMMKTRHKLIPRLFSILLSVMIAMTMFALPQKTYAEETSDIPALLQEYGYKADDIGDKAGQWQKQELVEGDDHIGWLWYRTHDDSEDDFSDPKDAEYVPVQMNLYYHVVTGTDDALKKWDEDEQNAFSTITFDYPTVLEYQETGDINAFIQFNDDYGFIDDQDKAQITTTAHDDQFWYAAKAEMDLSQGYWSWDVNDGGNRYPNYINGYLNFKKEVADPTSYQITVSATENGSVAADPAEAAEGDSVTLTVTPAEGYVLDTLAVTDEAGNAIDVKDDAFIMPASNVTISAVFVAEQSEAMTGTGTKEDPFVITTADQLAAFAESVDNNTDGNAYEDQYVKLGTDIDLAGINWNPIGVATKYNNDTNLKSCFWGDFDGDGHTISNMTIKDTYTAETNIGLFSMLGNKARIHDLNMTDVDIEVAVNGDWMTVRAGGIAGITGRITTAYQNELKNAKKTLRTAIIDSCSVSGNVVVHGSTRQCFSGGIIGQVFTYGAVINCVSYANAETTTSGSYNAAYAGSLIGMAGNENMTLNNVSFGNAKAINETSTMDNGDAYAAGILGMAGYMTANNYAVGNAAIVRKENSETGGKNVGVIAGQAAGGMCGDFNYFNSDAVLTITNADGTEAPAEDQVTRGWGAKIDGSPVVNPIAKTAAELKSPEFLDTLNANIDVLNRTAKQNGEDSYMKFRQWQTNSNGEIVPTGDYLDTASYQYTLTIGEGGKLNQYSPSKDTSGEAMKGETLRYLFDCEEGYDVKEVTITDKDGNVTKATEEQEGSYTYYNVRMPASDATINVTFTNEIYNIKVNTPESGGELGCDIQTAPEGKTVTVKTYAYTEPDRYGLKALHVKDANGNELETKNAGNDGDIVLYTFVMPAADVAVSADFILLPPEEYGIDADQVGENAGQWTAEELIENETKIGTLWYKIGETKDAEEAAKDERTPVQMKLYYHISDSYETAPEPGSGDGEYTVVTLKHPVAYLGGEDYSGDDKNAFIVFSEDYTLTYYKDQYSTATENEPGSGTVKYAGSSPDFVNGQWTWWKHPRENNLPNYINGYINVQTKDPEHHKSARVVAKNGATYLDLTVSAYKNTIGTKIVIPFTENVVPNLSSLTLKAVNDTTGKTVSLARNVITTIRNASKLDETTGIATIDLSTLSMTNGCTYTISIPVAPSEKALQKARGKGSPSISLPIVTEPEGNEIGGARLQYTNDLAAKDVPYYKSEVVNIEVPNKGVTQISVEHKWSDEADRTGYVVTVGAFEANADKAAATAELTADTKWKGTITGLDPMKDYEVKVVSIKSANGADITKACETTSTVGEDLTAVWGKDTIDGVLKKAQASAEGGFYFLTYEQGGKNYVLGATGTAMTPRRLLGEPIDFGENGFDKDAIKLDQFSDLDHAQWEIMDAGSGKVVMGNLGARGWLGTLENGNVFFYMNVKNGLNELPEVTPDDYLTLDKADDNTAYIAGQNSFGSPKSPWYFTGKSIDGSPYSYSKASTAKADAVPVSFYGLQIRQNVTVTTSVQKLDYTITVNDADHGTISVQNKTAQVGDTVELTVNADHYYELESLTVKTADGAEVEVKDDKFTMPAGDVTVEATFKKIDYTITINDVENGTVTADKEKANLNDTVKLTVTADKDYELDDLTIKDADDKDVEVADDYSFTMPAGNVTVTATFAKKEADLTAKVDQTEVHVGDKVTVTISNKAVKAFTLTGGITFDKELFDCTEIVPNKDVDFDAVSTVEEANEAGTVGFAIISDDRTQYDAADLVQITFIAKKAGEATFAVYENSHKNKWNVYEDDAVETLKQEIQEKTPGGNTPGGNTPGGNTPGGNTPGGNTQADSAAAADVVSKIDAIGTVTLESEAAINEAQAAYDALSDAAKALVTNVDTLEAAQTSLKALKEEAAAAAAAQSEAKSVIDKINAIGTVTLESEAAINEAQAAYDALSDAAKALVTNVDTLKAAQNTLADLKKEEQAAAQAASASLADEIAAAEAISNTDGTYTEASYKALQDAIKDAKALLASGTASSAQLKSALEAVQGARKTLDKAGNSQQGDAAKVVKGKKYKVNGQIYKVTKVAGKKAGRVILIKAKNKKKVSVPKTVKLADGKTYAVTAIAAKAFTGKKIRTVTIGANVKTIKKNVFAKSKVTKVIIKSKKLTKKKVKACLKGSKVTTITVKVGSKKLNKKYVKKYKKIFTKKNAGKKVKVK